MNKEIKIQQKRERCKNKHLFKIVTKDAAIVNGDDHVIEVKFASFGNVDSDGDLLVKGCFAKSINDRGPESDTNRKIAFLWQHDMRDPIGKILKLEEREDGAYATVRLSDFDAVPNAKRAYSQLSDGVLNQFSFGFEYIWDKMEYDESKDAFIIQEVKLHEVSVVTLGANEETAYVGEVEDMKAFVNNLKENNLAKYNELKEAIKSMEAEPPKALTSREFLRGVEFKIKN